MFLVKKEKKLVLNSLKTGLKFGCERTIYSCIFYVVIFCPGAFLSVKS